MTAIDRLAHTSRWRRRPLAEKAMLALGLMILAMILPPWPGGVLVLTVATGAALLGARVPAGDWLRAMLPPLAFILLGAAATLASLDFALAPPDAAIALTVRGSAAVASLLLLAMTTPASDLVRACRRLGLSAEVAEVALATYRFIFLLDETARAIHAGQTSRLGYDGFRRSIRSLGMLAAALLPRALERARRLEIGLAARGFDGALPSLGAHRPVSPAGMMAVIGLLIAIAGIGLWR